MSCVPRSDTKHLLDIDAFDDITVLNEIFECSLEHFLELLRRKLWLALISIAIRRGKKTHIPSRREALNERLLRHAITLTLSSSASILPSQTSTHDSASTLRQVGFKLPCKPTDQPALDGIRLAFIRYRARSETWQTVKNRRQRLKRVDCQ
jgi:hypothetical protein